MKKISLLLLFTLFLQSTSFANNRTGGFDSNDTMGLQEDGTIGMPAKEQALISAGNLTFYKDYSSGIADKVANPTTSINADYSLGSPTATFTASRGATTPATYISDASGTVTTTTTSNAPRFTYGFYNTTGFVSRPGLIIEGASTNLVPASAEFDDASWTATSVTVDDQTGDLNAPDGTATADLLTATGANGTVLLASAVTGATFSVWLRRKTGTGNIDITANGGTNYTTVTLVSGQWARFTVTAASASQKAGIRIVTSGDAVYAWGAQFENLGFATTYIPTTAGALTRNAETLTYPILNNRTAATESIFVKHTLEFALSASTAQFVMSTDTKVRQLSYRSTGPDFVFRPNATDSIGVTLNDTGAQNAFTSVVRSATCTFNNNPSTTAQHYKDAVSKGTSTTNFTSPVWGTNFYLGSDSSSANQLQGIIESCAIYSDVKALAEVTSITNIMNL